MLKKIVLIFLFSGFLISLTGFVFAQKPLEIIYPGVPGADTPTTTKTPLVEYIIYIFSLAIRIAGLIAFVSLIYGGFRYLTSAGSPGAMNDANSRIKASFLGLIVLLASYLILTTINPQLVKLKGEPIQNTQGVALWTGAGGTGDRWATQQSIPDLAGFVATYLEFKTSSENLDVIVYPETSYRGGGTKVDGSSPLGFTPRSIELVWEPPGVYLYKEPGCQGEYRVYRENSADLHSDGFGDSVRSLKIKNGEDENIRMAAFLHEHRYMGGKCVGYIQGGCSNDLGWMNNMASSITVFQRETSGPGSKTTLYDRTNHSGNELSFDGELTDTESLVGHSFNDKTESLKIEGNLLVALFEHDDATGKCSIFTESDLDLSDDPIGQCSGICGLWIGPWCAYQIYGPCASAIEIYGVKR